MTEADGVARLSYGDAVVALLNQSATLSREELIRLSKAADGVTGYLAQNRQCRQACRAVEEIMSASGLLELNRQVQDDALEATISAALRAVGKDPLESRVQQALSACRGHVGRAPQFGRSPTKRLRSIVRKEVGWALDRRIGPASLAAGMAAQALMTWDLADNQGTYTPQHRATLVSVWMSVTSLPSGYEP